MSGFSLRPGMKRPQGAKMALGPPKKPASVQDLFGGDDEDDGHGRDKKARTGGPTSSSAAPRLDAETVEVATKLADFVSKNGAQFEQMTRDRNSVDSPFRFLHDKSSPGYQFYAAKLREFEAANGTAVAPPLPPPPTGAGGPCQPSAGPSAGRPASLPPQPPPVPQSTGLSFLPPAAAAAVAAAAAAAKAAAAAGRLHTFSPAAQAPIPMTEEQVAEARRRAQIAMAQGDSVAAMEAFARLAAKQDGGRSASADPEDPDGRGGGGGDDEEEDEEERRRRRAQPLLNKTAFERRKTTAVFKDDGSRGHHMGDYIPKEVLAEFMAKTGDKVAAVQVEQFANKNAIGADNIGHKMLQKMGWKEGEGLGGTQKGITAPIRAVAAAAPAAGEARGLGATAVGEVTAEDDPFEAYRKRMMLGYKFRPNPLGNPRRAYY